MFLYQSRNGCRRVAAVVPLTALAVALMLGGCNLFGGASLGLSSYYDEVVGALPGTSASTRMAAFDTVKAELTDKLFSESADAVVSIPYGIAELDRIIAELNAVVQDDNTAAEDGATVTPATGAITLPFFGDLVDVDYEVELGGGKRAAYKVASDRETVILYNTYEGVWESPDPDVNVREHYIFYADRTSAGAITIKFALYAENTADAGYAKDWAAEITVDDAGDFAVSSVWGGVDSTTDEHLSGSLAAAGNRSSTFGVRHLSVGVPEVTRLIVDASSQSEIAFDETEFTALTVPGLKGASVASATGQTSMATIATAADSERPKHAPFTSAW